MGNRFSSITSTEANDESDKLQVDLLVHSSSLILSLHLSGLVRCSSGKCVFEDVDIALEDRWNITHVTFEIYISLFKKNFGNLRGKNMSALLLP